MVAFCYIFDLFLTSYYQNKKCGVKVGFKYFYYCLSLYLFHLFAFLINYFIVKIFEIESYVTLLIQIFCSFLLPLIVLVSIYIKINSSIEKDLRINSNEAIYDIYLNENLDLSKNRSILRFLSFLYYFANTIFVCFLAYFGSISYVYPKTNFLILSISFTIFFLIIYIAIFIISKKYRVFVKGFYIFNAFYVPLFLIIYFILFYFKLYYNYDIPANYLELTVYYNILYLLTIFIF